MMADYENSGSYTAPPSNIPEKFSFDISYVGVLVHYKDETNQEKSMFLMIKDKGQDRTEI